MGAWAYGPFDSDSALDWVGSLKSSRILVKEIRKTLKSGSPNEMRAAAATIEPAYNARLLNEDDVEGLGSLAVERLRGLEGGGWSDEWESKRSALRNLRGQIVTLQRFLDSVK